MTTAQQESSGNTSRKRLPLAALYAANGISVLGNTLTFIAIPWFVLQTTGSAAKTGLVSIAVTLPMIVVGLIGGIVVDRLGAKHTSIVSDLLSGITTALIPLLHHTVGLEFWQLLVLVAVGAVFDLPGHTARQALLPELAGLGNVRLERANAAAQTCVRVAQVFGPPLAGVLIAIIGTSNVLWIDAVTFGLSATIIAAFIPDTRHAPTQEEPHRSSILLDAREGLRFIRTDRLVLALMVTFSLGSLFAEPVYGIILPVYANEVLGSAVGLGIIYSALALGSVGGNLFFGAVGYRLPRRMVIVGGWVMRACSFFIFALQPGPWTIAILFALNGFLFEPTNAIFATFMQERVPAEMRGRVFGAFSTISFGTFPLGVLGYSLLIDAAGLQATLVVLAIVNVIPVLTLVRPSTWHDLRTIQRPAIVEPAPG